MERLTERNGKYVEYSDENYNDSVDNYTMLDKCLQKLADYEDAEEQGLLFRLPCKVGDTVWEVEEIPPHIITECKVDKFATDEAGVMYINYHSDNFGAKRYLDAFGDTLFLTKEEAEQKLASMQKG